MRKALGITAVASALVLGSVLQVQSGNLPNPATDCPAAGPEAVLPLNAAEPEARAPSLSDLIEQYTTESIRRAIDHGPDRVQIAS